MTDERGGRGKGYDLPGGNLGGKWFEGGRKNPMKRA